MSKKYGTSGRIAVFVRLRNEHALGVWCRARDGGFMRRQIATGAVMSCVLLAALWLPALARADFVVSPSGIWSASMTGGVSIMSVTPQVPQGLIARPLENSIQLYWRPNTDVGTYNPDTETYVYRVYRSTDPNFSTYELQTPEPTHSSICVTSTNRCGPVLNIPVTQGTRYYYRVTAAIKVFPNTIAAESSLVDAPQATTMPTDQPDFPIKGAFYYPWFPETWGSSPTTDPFTKYSPSSALGYYDSYDQTVVNDHIDQLVYGGLQVAIASWWGCSPNIPTGNTCPSGGISDTENGGISHREGERFKRLLDTTYSRSGQAGLKWALYYEQEGPGYRGNSGTGNPSVSEIVADLRYIKDHYAYEPNYLRIGYEPVIFVYSANETTCDLVNRWNQANDQLFAQDLDWRKFRVVLKVFDATSSGGQKWTDCTSPSYTNFDWHQYAPSSPVQAHSAGGVDYSYVVSPGFDTADDNGTGPQICSSTITTNCRKYLRRNLDRWNANIRGMLASTARWKLVTTFNEYGEGSAIENSKEWQSPVQSGQTRSFGRFLDALHNNGDPNPSSSDDDPVIYAGDISPSGGSSNTTATSNVLVNSDTRTAQVLTLGDNQYDAGALTNYVNYFAPAWGRERAITAPVPGNHEYNTANAEGYFDYWNNGAEFAGQTSPDVVNGIVGRRYDAATVTHYGYYSYDIDVNGDGTNEWHLIALNSGGNNCGGGASNNGPPCTAGSPQDSFFENELASQPDSRCVLAYWHQPRWLVPNQSHSDNAGVAELWNDAYNTSSVAKRVDLVLNGHAHNIEVSNQLNASGGVTTDGTGVREFVVGTGGAGLYTISAGTSDPRFSGWNSTDHGVLKLTLHQSSYDWQFISTDGTYTNQSSAPVPCH